MLRRFPEVSKIVKKDEAEKIFSGCSVGLGSGAPSRWERRRNDIKAVDRKPTIVPRE